MMLFLLPILHFLNHLWLAYFNVITKNYVLKEVSPAAAGRGRAAPRSASLGLEFPQGPGRHGLRQEQGGAGGRAEGQTQE